MKWGNIEFIVLVFFEEEEELVLQNRLKERNQHLVPSLEQV